MGGDEEQLIMSRLIIRLSQPNLAEVGIGAELGKNTKQAGAELGQAQIRLELGFISNQICCPKLTNKTKGCY